VNDTLYFFLFPYVTKKQACTPRQVPQAHGGNPFFLYNLRDEDSWERGTVRRCVWTFCDKLYAKGADA
jgi:hypothetical protein